MICSKLGYKNMAVAFCFNSSMSSHGGSKDGSRVSREVPGSTRRSSELPFPSSESRSGMTSEWVRYRK